MDARKDSNPRLYIPGSGEEGSEFPKIVALSVPFPGAKRPLEEGAKLGWWDLVLIDRDRVDIPPADIYLFGAYHYIYERLMNLPEKKGILWTSSVGEMDLEPVEQEFLRQLLRDPRISFIWFGDPSLEKAFPDKSFHARYPLVVENKIPEGVEKQNIATLFCPSGPKKNILNQLIAMQLVQKKTDLVLHTNIGDSYAPYLSNLTHIQHGWLPTDEYEKLISTAKVNLAVSWAETYNYQVAEALMLGTVSLISPTIHLPGAMVGDPNNPQEIAEIIEEVLEDLYIAPTPRYLETLQTMANVNNSETGRILFHELNDI